MQAAEIKFKGDHLATAFVILFLAKPFIDLFYAYSVSVAGIRISPLTASGLLVFLYFGYQNLRYPRISAPYLTLFKIFLLINVISMMIGAMTVGPRNLSTYLDFSVRVGDAYLIYAVSYIAVMRARYTNLSRVFFVIAIGSSLPILINMIAIKMGYGGAKVNSEGMLDGLRETGLYYDPGGLANVALFGCIFTLFSIQCGVRFVWKLFAGVLVLVGLYLIYLSLSRAVILEVVIFAVLYVLFVVRGVYRVAIPGLFAGAVLVMVSAGLIDIDRLIVRFQGDLEVVESISERSASDGFVESGGDDAEVLTRLGNNRGQLWVDTFSSFIERDFFSMALGNFSSSSSHSDYMDILSRNGAIGLLSYVLLLLAMLITSWRNYWAERKNAHFKLVHIAAFCLITLYIAYAFPFRPLQYTTTAWYMWTMLGASMAIARLRRMPEGFGQQAG